MEYSVPPEHAGERFDWVVAQWLTDYSRSRLQEWIKAGWITLNGQQAKAKEKVSADDVIRADLDTALASLDVGEWEAQPLPLDIVFEDEHIIIVNKQAGLVVHPGAGNPDQTLINALLHHNPDLATLPRAGIIHRLDKDTTGLLVVAKNLESHTNLVEQLQERSVKREYRTIVMGTMVSGGTIDQPLGRHPVDRTRQAVVSSGKPAVTHYRILERFRAHTYLRVQLETGRTHQIRVHMAHIRHPIVGDTEYMGRLRLPAGATEELKQALRDFPRQALHAFSLGFRHPHTGEPVEFEAPVPDDIEELLKILRANETESRE
jgi:23S rRNA pseudouridine1911/1915/1917 synthase